MIKKIINSGIIILCLSFLTSCGYEDVEFKRAENFSFKKFEGKTVSITFDAILNNPNGYNIKVKPSTFDLYLNDVEVGKIHLDDKVKIVKKSEVSVLVPITADLNNASLPKLLTSSLRKTVKVRIVGKAKGGVFLFSTSKKIDETREIPLKDFKLLDNIPFLGGF